MKEIRNDKYFIWDIINMVLGGLLIILGIFAFIDIDMHEYMLPFILFLGGFINMVNGSRRKGNSKILKLFYYSAGYLCIIMACMIWMGFGGIT